MGCWVWIRTLLVGRVAFEKTPRAGLWTSLCRGYISIQSFLEKCKSDFSRVIYGTANYAKTQWLYYFSQCLWVGNPSGAGLEWL